jgi:hypothetical protein
MSAAFVLSFSGLLLWACAASWRSRAASRWPIAPAHHCTASDTVKDIGDHRLRRGARELLRGGDGGISFSKRSQHVDGQLLQAPVTLGPFTTTLRTHLGCSQPRCLNVCLPVPASLVDRDPHSRRLFRLTERSSPEMQLERRTNLSGASVSSTPSSARSIHIASNPWGVSGCVVRACGGVASTREDHRDLEYPLGRPFRSAQPGWSDLHLLRCRHACTIVPCGCRPVPGGLLGLGSAGWGTRLLCGSYRIGGTVIRVATVPGSSRSWGSA